MNSMKTLMVMGVLAAAGYWTYMNMGQKPESPPANAQVFSGPPTVEIPGLSSPAPQLTGTTFSPPANTSPALLGGGNISGFSANSTPAAGLGGSTAAGTAAGALPPANTNAVTLLTPSSPATQNVSQGSAATGTSPNLLSGSTAGQTPAATNSPPYSPPSAAAPSNSDGNFQNKFAEFMLAVQKKLDEGRLPEAHLALSSLYDNPDLPQTQARQVSELLDQLAGTVIYSRQHYLEQPFLVRPGDTLDQIAEKYNVPAVLLARINGIRDPQQLEPGRELKVVRGPFNAVIHLDKHELSLMVEGRYAGRFPIGVGCDQPKLEGTYTVCEKNVNPPYRGPDGVNVPGGDPRNPLGKFWIGLSDKVGLHGTIDPQNVGRDDNRGTICLGERDIDDLYGILSVGSRVVIQR